MILKAHKILPATLLILLIFGCKKNFSLDEDQVIFFQFDCVNNLQEYEHYGYFIDNQGNILTYYNPEIWNYPDSSLSLNKKQVEENLLKCTHSGKKVSVEELLRYSHVIKNISSSKVTAIKNSLKYEGKTEFICYQYNKNTGIYFGSILKMDGEQSCENLNFYTKKIVSWMKDIHSAIYSK
jgi:hypothetical protein